MAAEIRYRTSGMWWTSHAGARRAGGRHEGVVVLGACGTVAAALDRRGDTASTR